MNVVTPGVVTTSSRSAASLVTCTTTVPTAVPPFPSVTVYVNVSPPA